MTGKSLAAAETSCFTEKTVPFRLAIVNLELMHECSLWHLRMKTARMEQDIEGEGKKRRVNMKEVCTVVEKKVQVV